jgi:uncharacterized protein (TIGR00297 family)
MASHPHRGEVLRWQSQLVLAFTVLPVFAALLVQTLGFSWIAPSLLLKGAAIGAGFGLLAWGLRAATPGAALTGPLFTAGFYYAVPGWRTVLWPLFALFFLTVSATRFGRARKEQLLVAEERRGRSAYQVAANLGAAALAGVAMSLSHFAVLAPTLSRSMLIALVAALAEATADTLSSELGEVLGGEPLLLTTLQRVSPGTDGAISMAGTLAGCVGAGAIVLLSVLILPLSWAEGLIALAAGVFGLFFDSLLGATLERRGWLNNDAVNFLSTCAAAVCGALVFVARS